MINRPGGNRAVRVLLGGASQPPRLRPVFRLSAQNYSGGDHDLGLYCFCNFLPQRKTRSELYCVWTSARKKIQSVEAAQGTGGSLLSTFCMRIGNRSRHKTHNEFNSFQVRNSEKMDPSCSVSWRPRSIRTGAYRETAPVIEE